MGREIMGVLDGSVCLGGLIFGLKYQLLWES